METLRFELRPRGVGVPLCYLYTKFPLILYPTICIGPRALETRGLGECGGSNPRALAREREQIFVNDLTLVWCNVESNKNTWY